MYGVSYGLLPLFKVCGGASPSCRRNPLTLGRGGSQRPPQPDDMPPSDVVELEVLKQRQGAIGTIRLKFEGIYTRFTDNLPT